MVVRLNRTYDRCLATYPGEDGGTNVAQHIGHGCERMIRSSVELRCSRGSSQPGRSLRLRSPLATPLAIALAVAVLFAQTGCVSAKYKFAAKNTPPALTLDVHFPPAPLDANLTSVITDGGPGSWKREAFWDEYIVTLHNTGDRPLQLVAVRLVDFAGTPRPPGEDPWALERESKTLERKYKDAGVAFARVASPRILAATAEPVVVANAGIGAAGAATAATLTAVAVPVYGLATLGRNRHYRAKIKTEFDRRRVKFPLSLAPGETRTGSLFFPMVPNPCSLDLNWSDESASADAVLPLDFLKGLHTKTGSEDTVLLAPQSGCK
jgi:hypothetical protein